LSFLDAKSLCQAELVCVGWKRRIADGMLWKKLIEKKAKTNSLWKGLSVRRGWYVIMYYHVQYNIICVHLLIRKKTNTSCFKVFALWSANFNKELLT